MPNPEDFPFDFEFYNETALPDAEYYETAYSQITAAAEGHHDIVGAAVSLKELSGDETPHAYQATVALYVRSNNIAATEIMPAAMDAMQAALDQATQQVRDMREKLRNY